MTMIERAIAHAHDNHDRYLEDFKTLLRIPSISTDPAYDAHVEEAAAWLVDEMTRIGFDHAQRLETDGKPLVYGDWLHAGPERPTILIYAHYDVQPVEPVSRWDTDPFEPTIIGDKLYARGAMDDKCGVMINLKALQALLETSGRLPLNVKLIFEGEEESSSAAMPAAVEQYRDLLSADLLVVCDGGSDPEQPYIITSVRGIVGAEVTVTGPAHDLHSGKYGGVVHNPLHVVGRMIAGLHDDQGWVQLPGFYDNVTGATPAEAAALRAIEPQFKAFQKKYSGAPVFWGVPAFTHLERVGYQPTADVNGMWGGYAGEGVMTIIPAEAGFKVTFRLVPAQRADDVMRAFETYIASFESETVDIAVTIADGIEAARLLHDGPVIDALQAAYRAVWGQAAVLLGLGGSVPIMGMFQQIMGIPMTMLGFGQGDGQHAPNEYLYLEHFQRGIDTAIHFYCHLAKT